MVVEGSEVVVNILVVKMTLVVVLVFVVEAMEEVVVVATVWLSLIR